MTSSHQLLKTTDGRFTKTTEIVSKFVSYPTNVANVAIGCDDISTGRSYIDLKPVNKDLRITELLFVLWPNAGVSNSRPYQASGELQHMLRRSCKSAGHV